MKTYCMICCLGCVLLIAAPLAAFDFKLGKGKVNVNELIDLGKKTIKAMKSTDLPPEQEYYVGRSVSAAILQEYRLLDDPQAIRYLNLVGQAVARASDRPEMFTGYHFAILDSDEVNALSAPGGYVFVTRGLLACCASEDALAAVLAHEVAHVVLKHGLMFIKEKRVAPLTEFLVSKAAENINTGDLAKLTDSFAGSLSDINENLIHGQYSSRTEARADEHALEILQRLGYDPTAFLEVLAAMDAQMDQTPRGARAGFFKTHPSPASRSAVLSRRMGDCAPLDRSARTERFAQAMTPVRTGP